MGNARGREQRRAGRFPRWVNDVLALFGRDAGGFSISSGCRMKRASGSMAVAEAGLRQPDAGIGETENRQRR